jgi:hypothetical protein
VAKGSTTTYGGWESRVCDRCGGKIVKDSKRLAPVYQHLFFSRFGGPGGTPASWHMTCPPTSDGA